MVVVIVKRVYQRDTTDRTSVAMYVMQKTGGNWYIAAFQNTFVQ